MYCPSSLTGAAGSRGARIQQTGFLNLLKQGYRGRQGFTVVAAIFG